MLKDLYNTVIKIRHQLFATYTCNGQTVTFTSFPLISDDDHLHVAINLYWGSEIMTSDGIVLNDEMDGFSS